jgi:hypothetical protein
VQQDGRHRRAVDRERLDDFDLAFEAERLAEGAFRLLDRFGLVFALDTDRLGADFALPVDFLVDFVAATFAPARAVDFLAMDLARPDDLFATEAATTLVRLAVLRPVADARRTVVVAFALTPPATRSPRLAAASTAAPARCAAAATALASSSARTFSASAAACAAPSAANAASLTGSFMTASLCPTKV